MNIFEELEQGLISASAEESAGIGCRLAESLPENAVLALQGDLGAGKTTLVKGLAVGFGIEDTVKSPTFNLVSIYEGRRQLVHIDAYRLDSAEALDALMLDEFLRSPFCLAIEWPEKIAPWLPADTFWLTLSATAEGGRRIVLKKPLLS